MKVKIIFSLFVLLIACYSAKAQTPIISKVTPIGTYPGNSILISGSGFSPTPANLHVWFDQVRGTVTASTDFSITVTVPAQSRLGNIKVTNLTSGLSASSNLRFVPSYSGSDFDQTKVTAPLSFSAAGEIFDVCSCDFNGDGKTDLAGSKNFGSASDIILLTNTSTVGNLSFNPSTLTTASPSIVQMINVACGDLNGDGKPELLSTRNDITKNEVWIYTNTSGAGISFSSTVTRLFLDPGQSAFRVVVKDVNLDGKSDVIVTNSNNTPNNTMYVYQNTSVHNGTPSFDAPVKIAITGANTTYGLDVQDLDGDHKPEIIVNQFTSNDIFIVTNSSTTALVAFSTIQKITLAGTLNHLKTADFNEDDKLDIAVTSTFNNKTFILLNTTSGSSVSFAAPITVDAGNNPFGIDVSDIDGDGDVDIIMGNIGTTSTDVTVLRSDGNNANLTFTPLNVAVGKKSKNLRVGDYDGDGKPDIAFTTVNFNSLDIVRNTNCFKPQILNTGPITICAGQTINLNATPGFGVTQYDWQHSVNGPVGTNSPTLAATIAGNYTVTATSEGGACMVSSAVFTITSGAGAVPVTDPPTTVSSNSPVCTGVSLQLNTPTVASVGYSWTGPNGFTSTSQNPVIPGASAADAGLYTLRLTNGTCASTPVTTQVNVADLDNFEISSSEPSNTICAGGSGLTLSVNNLPGYSFQWKKGGADIVGQTTSILTVTAADVYTVKVTNNALTCSIVTAPVTVKVVSVPVSNFTVKSPACVGEVLTFTNTSTTDAQATAVYAWNFGDAATSTLQNPTHAYASAATFNSGLTVSYAGVTNCSNLAPKSIVVTQPAVPVVTALPTSSCPGENVSLSVPSTFTNVTWTNTSSTGASITVTQPGTYVVSATDATGCATSGQVIVGAKAVPVLIVTVDKPIIGPGESAQLAATGANTYSWTPIETLNNATLANPIATPTTTTTYTVTGTEAGGCSASQDVKVTVDSDLIAIKSPNVFSPNGDGINDLWIIQGIENYADCTLTLFNKDGIKIFEQKGYTNNWDGLYQGSPVPPGTYYYVFGCPDKTPLSGHVLVAR